MSRPLLTGSIRIRLVLLLVTGVFVATILGLLLTLQTFVATGQRSLQRQRARLLEAIAQDLDSQPAMDDGPKLQSMASLSSRYGFEGLSLERPGQSTLMIGNLEQEPRGTRILNGGRRVTAVFETTPLDHFGHEIRTFVSIGVVVTIVGGLLLMMYMTSVGRTVENLLGARDPGGLDDQHPDPTSYLIDTFSTSLTALRSDASELRRLRDIEKSRADELARVTATLVRSLTSGFIALDSLGKIVDMNVAAKEILGLPPSLDPSRRSATEVLGDTPFARTLTGAIADRVGLQRIEIDQQGASAVIGLSTVPLQDDEGRHLGMLVLFTDLTDVRRLEDRVRDMQSLADLGEMSAGIAHEFRNSLSTIIGYLRLARREELPGNVDERLHHAEAEAAELTDAVERLMTFARPMTPRQQTVSLHEVISSVLERVIPLSDETSFVLHGDDFSLEGDTSILARAFENVLRNSAQAIQRKGAAGHVTITIDGASRQITIEDDGSGVDPAEVPRLFLPFQSNSSGGFGIGLALVRKIVLVHGGTIQMTGRLGEGTTVTMDFGAPPD